MQTITIDPVTRIEGHLKIEAKVDGNEVKEARSTGTLFRGFEMILKGRDPRDAQRITQRICGVCPTGHSIASTLNLDAAFGIADKIPHNGRVIRNLILGCNFLQSHILHFYHLAALDYVDVTAAADYEGADPVLNSLKAFIDRGALGPFLPRYEGDYRLSKDLNRAAAAHYVQALDVRRQCHELGAVFGARMPMNQSVIPGGASETPTVDKIAQFLWKLEAIRRFIDDVYIPDVLAVAGAYGDYAEIGTGCRNYLAYGCFDIEDGVADPLKRKRALNAGRAGASGEMGPVDAGKISEDVKHSWFTDACASKPAEGDTVPDPHKAGAYSWLKSPRYEGEVYEVGPLARIYVNYLAGHPGVKPIVDGALGRLKAGPEALLSTLGRHAARALEAKFVADAMAAWVATLKPGEPICADYEIPEASTGAGLSEAPRGALGHWIRIEDRKIANYQCVVPTTWNGSPRDAQGRPGPIEQAIEGTKIRDAANPFEIVRIVRSFDPCLACAVHVVNGKGRPLAKYRIDV